MSVPDLSHLKGSETILVTMVCYGNICRSPMAAAVLVTKLLLFHHRRLLLIQQVPRTFMLAKVQILHRNEYGNELAIDINIVHHNLITLV